MWSNLLQFAWEQQQIIAFAHDCTVHFCTINLCLSRVFHADEHSSMLCNITQSVKWLLGSPGYHSSPCVRLGWEYLAIFDFAAITISYLAYPLEAVVIVWSHLQAVWYCLQVDSSGNFLAFHALKLCLRKLCFHPFFPLKAVVSYPLPFFGLMVKCKGMLESYLPLAGMQS